MSSLLENAPEEMTARARAFLTVVSLRNFLIGLSFLATPDFYGPRNPVYTTVRSIAPIEAWGCVMLAVFAVAGHAALSRDRRWATWAITASATLTGALTGAMCVQWSLLREAPSPMSPLLPILGLALVAKDLVIARQPLRSPLESTVRRIMADFDDHPDAARQAEQTVDRIRRSRGGPSRRLPDDPRSRTGT